MGWLRDLMSSSKPPSRSFGTLAGALLSDPDWPSNIRIQPRSLAALLSKLDADRELSWLDDRPDVQALLARRIQCSVSDISRHTGRQPTGRPERLVRWDDLRYARTLDLVEEDLPPGIPLLLQDPAAWNGCWWIAPSGSGRTLTGRWLAARGLAHFSAADHFQAIPDSGAAPLFLELDSVDARTPLAPPRRAICVAAPAAPPDGHAWNVVTSPPLNEYLTDLVTWAVARLPADGAVAADDAIAWLEKLPSAELENIGSVLGLIGVIDELGLREVKRLDLYDVAKRFLSRRLGEQLGTSSADTAWLRRHGLEVLSAMARRCLTDTDSAWESWRSFDAWLALVPDEYRSGLEVEWLRLSLSRVDSSIRPDDIERAAKKISPGAFRVLRGLTGAGLFRERESLLAPRPHWLASAIGNEARRRLLDASPFEWGEAMLRPHAAPDLGELLLQRVRGGDSRVLADVLELEARENPAHAAAVETAFRVAGIGVLSGQELDNDLVESLWEEQLQLAIDLDGLPRPLIAHPTSARTALLHLGTWYLAALALSETLVAEGSLKPTLLAPWSMSSPPPELERVYDEIEKALASPAARSFRPEAHALIERLRSALGSVSQDRPHALELPGLAIEEALHGVLSWERARNAGDWELLLSLSRDASQRNTIASELWNAWQRAGTPDLGGSPLSPSATAAAPIWQALPPPLAALAVERAEAEAPLALSLLSDARWNALAESWQAHPPPHELMARAAELVPETAAPRFWQFADSVGLAKLWQRFPNYGAELLSHALGTNEIARALSLVRAAPREASERALGALAEIEPDAPSASAARSALRSFLHGVVASREAGWRDAYALLARI